MCLKALSLRVQKVVQVRLKALSPCVEGCTGVFKSSLSVCRRLYSTGVFKSSLSAVQKVVLYRCV